MDELKFWQWLIDKKKMEKRSARDVVSRLKRIKNILGTEEIQTETIRKLDSNEEFLKCSISVKSQLRRAVGLYIEFNNGSEKK